MNDEIKVLYVNERSDFDKVATLYNDPEINNTFNGYRADRLISSLITFLITLNDKPIGFILLVKEVKRKNSLGIDIALKKEYRKNGYGKKAMEIFRDRFLKLIQDNLHAEVSKDNIAANKLLDVLNKEYIETIDNSDFYQISK